MHTGAVLPDILRDDASAQGALSRVLHNIRLHMDISIEIGRSSHPEERGQGMVIREETEEE